MRFSSSSDPRSGAANPAFALVLRRADGSAWPLTFSAGIERFIGAYPRVEGLCAEGELLRYARAARADHN